MRYITPVRFLLPFGMRKLLLTGILFLSCSVCFSQTRKTRSDKGGKHKSHKYEATKTKEPKRKKK